MGAFVHQQQQKPFRLLPETGSPSKQQVRPTCTSEHSVMLSRGRGPHPSTLCQTFLPSHPTVVMVIVPPKSFLHPIHLFSLLPSAISDQCHLPFPGQDNGLS